MARVENETYCSWPINPASGLGLNENASQSDYKGCPVAYDMILPLQRFQLLGIVVLEQGHINIDCHSEVPERIGR